MCIHTVTCVSIIGNSHPINVSIISKIKSRVISQRGRLNIDWWLTITATCWKWRLPILWVLLMKNFIKWDGLDLMRQMRTCVTPGWDGWKRRKNSEKWKGNCSCWNKNLMTNQILQRHILPRFFLIPQLSSQGFSWVRTTLFGLMTAFWF